jgi:VanZ family protein
VSTWCCVVLLAVLSLLPAQEMARTGMPGQVEHLIAYAGSAIVATAGYQQSQGAFRIIGLLCMYAAILEVLQHLSPGRHPSIGDFAASALGALAGGLGILLVSRLSLSSERSEAGS